MTAEALRLRRCISVVQCKRVGLVFHNNARTEACRIGKLLPQILRQRLGPIKYLMIVQAHFGPMPTDRRQPQRREQPIEIADRPAADQSNGATRQIEQVLERRKQRFGNLHFGRRRADINNRAVHVEQKGNRSQIKLGENIHDWVVGNRLHHYNSVR